MAWLKPDWMYGSEGFSRRQALKTALREGAYLYIFVGMFLPVAAIVETVTIAFIAGA